MSTDMLLASRPPVPDQLIVARDHAVLFQTLREIAYRDFTVIVDRREEERRQRVQPVTEERRGGERRSPLTTAVTSPSWKLCWSARATACRMTAGATSPAG